MTEHHTTLIAADVLHRLQTGHPDTVLVCDCSFDLTDADAGVRGFNQAHVPHAVYVHLEGALSGHATGQNGRHPLPDPDAFVRTLAELGASDDTQIVACDAGDGLYAARLWWLARWVGHERVAVLDGGLRAWRQAGLPVDSGASPARRPGTFTRRPAQVATVDHATVRENLETAASLIVDARSPERFRGENETLDPVGGHIPGAVNRFYKDNLGPDGRFKPPAVLRAEFDRITGGREARTVISQCGSGVTACHNLLAMTVAGLPGAALYGGSWSEWCVQPGVPIATGSD